MDLNKKRELVRTEIFLYSTANFGISIINASILGFVLFFYLTEGLTGVRLSALVIGALVGTALMVGRIVDAFVNPVVGWLSDNTRWKRWGRRRPFVIVGIVPMTLSFILLFNPPIYLLTLFPNGLGESLLIIYLFVIISIFDALFTFVFVPIYALLPEIAPTSEERITLAVWGNIFAILANVIGVVIAPMMYDSLGFSTTSIILALIVFISIIAVLPIQEFSPEEIKQQPRISIKESLGTSLKNRPYQIYLVNQIGMQFSFRILNAILPFFAVSVLYLELGEMMILTAPWIIVAIISFPVWGVLAKPQNLGKKRAYILSMIIFSVPLLLSFLFLASPGNIFIALIMISLIGFGMGGLWIFPPTIVGDIVDDEERRIGLRRESMYYAFQEFTEKLAISLAIFLEGIILGLFVVDVIPHPNYINTGLDIPYYIYDPLGPILLMGVIAFLPMVLALLIFIKFPKELIIENQ
jgi:GPH family glycoside/pentoside/hexuronide:cation symporter